MKKMRIHFAAFFSITFIMLIVCFQSPGYSSEEALTFEERVHYQTKIELVFFQHRTGQAVAFEQVFPVELIEARVRSYLLKNALANQTGIPVTEALLLHELNRIKSTSQAPEVLQELFSSLDDNETLIKEILVRPLLAERMIRRLFLLDTEYQQEQKAKAQSVLSECNLPVWGMLAMTYDINHYKRALNMGAEEELLMGNGGGADGSTVLNLERDVYEERLSGLRGGQAPRLRETEYSFVIERLLDEVKGTARIESLVIPKRSYEEWLDDKAGFMGEYDYLQASYLNSLNPEASSADIPFRPPGGIVPTAGCSANTWAPMPIPEPRVRHCTVWTGTEMMVWGGRSETGLHNTGFRYTPSTDSWIVMSGIGAPEARENHTGVWTGTEMIVWGGNSSYLNSGGRYNPTTDTWSTLSIVGAPGGRRYHEAVWSGTKMIVWGGNNGVDINTGGRYDPATDNWLDTTTTDAPGGRRNFKAVWAGSVMVVWGGFDTSTRVDTGGRYDPVSDSWLPTTLTDAPTARSDHSAVWTGTEVIVWSGYGNGGIYYNTGGRYDPALDSWTPTSTGAGVPAPSRYHSAVWTGTEMIIWGGFNFGSYYYRGARYTPTTDTWVAVTQTGRPDERSDHSAVWTGSLMVIWGGYNSTDTYLKSGGRYDPTTNSWTPTGLPASPTPRSLYSIVWTGSEVIIWGGNVDPGMTNTGSRYTPATNSWMATTTTNAPGGRYFHSAVWTGTYMVVWGGTNGTRLNTGGRYNVASNTWTDTSMVDVPGIRQQHTAVWSGTEMIVWGGITAGCCSYTDTGGRYDPIADTWVATSLTGAPSARTTTAAEWTGSEMIIWSGNDGTYTNTGGLYDPVTNLWSPTATSGAPMGRQYHRSVWTGSEMIVWGGRVCGGACQLDTGGIYDPVLNSWNDTSTVDAPTARFNHSQIWTGSEVIVWGGYSSGFVYYDTGGRYNPCSNSWTPVTSANAPTGRTSIEGAWTGSGMVIWGGNNVDGALETGGIYTPYCDLSCDSIDVVSTPVCVGTSQAFTVNYSGGSAPYTVEWDWTTDGSYDTVGNSVDYTYPGPGTYDVTARVSTCKGGQSCTTTTSVTVDPTPAPVITEGACAGPNVTLDAGLGFSSYLWAPGSATTQTLTVAGDGTTYTVTVTDGNGCSGQDSLATSVCLPPPPEEPSDVYGSGEGPMSILNSTSAFETDEQLDADTYNIYEGSFGTWYAFDDQSCFLVGSSAGPGRIALDHSMLPGSHWYLLSASNTGGESNAGHDNGGVVIPGVCGANP